PLDLVPRLFFSFITRGPTRSTLFPYTTLFRSDEPVDGVGRAGPQLGVLGVGVVGGDLELAAEAGAGGDPVHDHPRGRHPVLGAVGPHPLHRGLHVLLGPAPEARAGGPAADPAAGRPRGAARLRTRRRRGPGRWWCRGPCRRGRRGRPGTPRPRPAARPRRSRSPTAGATRWSSPRRRRRRRFPPGRDPRPGAASRSHPTRGP